jgi:hypothetical protein
MPANYVLLEKVTVGATSVSSVTFSSIPQTGYTDLVLVTSTRNNAAWPAGEQRIEFNGSSVNLSAKALYGTGNAGVGSYSATVIPAYANGGTSAANTFGSAVYYIPNYTSSTFKSVSSESVFEDNAAQASQYVMAGLWSSTSAITSITLTTSNNSSGAAASFVQGSTFYLYGVAKLGTSPAISPKATGGDIIDTDGTYWYHTFLSSGTFTPGAALSCDYLVVAGGGGGGKHQGGGGGAGGLRSTVTATGGGGSLESKLSLLSGTGYTVTIGAGGAGTSTGNTAGLQGSNSVFSTITSTGGGGGGYYNTNTATNGGSGGGAPGGAVAKTAGTGTANQGYAGGVGCTDSSGNGGGGGGAGAIGGTAVNGTSAGNGGVGVAVSITGSSVYYAGGGGGGRQANGSSGGTGGTGGGGTGAQGDGQTAGSGTANTGGGGGGETQNNGTSGNGGSGIVIVRYAV